MMNVEMAPVLKEKYDERLKKMARVYSEVMADLMVELWGEDFETTEPDIEDMFTTLMPILAPYIDKAMDEVLEEKFEGD